MTLLSFSSTSKNKAKILLWTLALSASPIITNTLWSTEPLAETSTILFSQEQQAELLSIQPKQILRSLQKLAKSPELNDSSELQKQFLTIYGDLYYQGLFYERHILSLPLTPQKWNSCWHETFEFMLLCYQCNIPLPQACMDLLKLQLHEPKYQFLKACLHSKGLGVPEDITLAMDIWQQLVEQEFTPAYHLLSTEYLIKNEFNKAIALLEESARHGQVKSNNKLLKLKIEENILSPEEIYHHLKITLENGFPDAYAHLGNLLHKGLLFQIDPVKSFNYYKLSAASGNAQSYLSLGKFCEEGIHAEPDLNLAFQYYMEGAAQNEDDCVLHLLNLFYHKEIGVEHQDFILERLEYFADQKNVGHLMNLATVYYLGSLGKAKDLHKAGGIYQQVIDINPANLSAHFNLAVIDEEKNNDKLTEVGAQHLHVIADNANLTPEHPAHYLRIESAHKLSMHYDNQNDVKKCRFYGTMAADAEHLGAMAHIGLNFIMKEPKEVEKGLYYRHKVAIMDSENPNIEHGERYLIRRVREQLAQWHLRGLWIPQDFQKAADYFQLSAHGGDLTSYYYIGKLLASGLVTFKNSLTPLDCFQRALASKNAIDVTQSKYQLGYHYLHGICVEKDIEKALSYLNDAGNDKIYDAYALLGNLYLQGVEVPKDTQKAYAYYLRGTSDFSKIAAFACDKISDFDTDQEFSDYVETVSKDLVLSIPSFLHDSYLKGLFHTKNLQKSFQTMSSIEHCKTLISHHAEGLGTPQDEAKAIFHLQHTYRSLWLNNTLDLIQFKTLLKNLFQENDDAAMDQILTDYSELESDIHEVQGGVFTLELLHQDLQSAVYKANHPFIPLHCLYQPLHDISRHMESMLKLLPKLNEKNTLINFLSLKRNPQRAEGANPTPYVMKHTIHGENYLTFGENHVQVVEEFTTLLNRPFDQIGDETVLNTVAYAYALQMHARHVKKDMPAVEIPQIQITFGDFYWVVEKAGKILRDKGFTETDNLYCHPLLENLQFYKSLCEETFPDLIKSSVGLRNDATKKAPEFKIFELLNR